MGESTKRWSMMKTQASDAPPRLGQRIYDLVLSVPVNTKVTGIMLLPVLILGFSLNYWMTSGLSDWLSYLLSDARVEAAMEAGRRSVTLVTVLATAAPILLAAVLTSCSSPSASNDQGRPFCSISRLCSSSR